MKARWFQITMKVCYIPL